MAGVPGGALHGREYVYAGPVYAAGEPGQLCPWCIADGSAANSCRFASLMTTSRGTWPLFGPKDGRARRSPYDASQASAGRHVPFPLRRTGLVTFSRRHSS
ncbi:CbrC family protein [Streptomyces flaveolus]|uniref:CbrC family protein n=1 Tax=Streptomyces flaveolus TaxID=67297 RepID=UPI0033172305